jgi:hypothetical protein
MNEPVDVSFGDSNNPLLPSQYNDLFRRRSSVHDGECRLLWAVLQDAIRRYLANIECLTPNQRSEFEEVRRWFRPGKGHQPRRLFAFETVCDLLGINSDLLLRGLDSICVSDLPKRGRRDAGTTRLGRQAA